MIIKRTKNNFAGNVETIFSDQIKLTNYFYHLNVHMIAWYTETELAFNKDKHLIKKKLKKYIVNTHSLAFALNVSYGRIRKEKDKNRCIDSDW